MSSAVPPPNTADQLASIHVDVIKFLTQIVPLAPLTSVLTDAQFMVFAANIVQILTGLLTSEEAPL